MDCVEAHFRQSIEISAGLTFSKLALADFSDFESLYLWYVFKGEFNPQKNTSHYFLMLQACPCMPFPPDTVYGAHSSWRFNF